MENYNPLQVITKWLKQYPTELQNNLANFIGLVHPTLATDPSLAAQYLFDHLDSQSLTSKEIITRSLIIIKMIDFSLCNRSTDKDWEEALDNLLDMRKMLSEKNQDTSIVDYQLNNHPSHKKIWMTLAAHWQTLTDSELSNKAIADWYASEIIKKI